MIRVSTNAKTTAGIALLCLWAVGVSVILTLLMAGHTVPFLAQRPSAAAARFARQLTGGAEGWRLLHVVADGCLCSNDVVEHLLARGRDPQVAGEGVLLVNGHRPDLKDRLAAAGFAYAEASGAEAAAATEIEAAPTLVVIDDAGGVRYAGGYYQRRERTEARDTEIVRDLRRGQDVAPLPLFGCAFSKRLQAAVDPLGLKYKEALKP